MTQAPTGKSKLRDGLQQSEPQWRNWSGFQRCQPAQKYLPESEQELSQIIRQAKRVRVVGAGHSFSPLVPTEHTLVSLDKLSGLVAHDPERLQASFWAGTRIAHMGEPLMAVGQALHNQGDIDHQALGGAVGTGTHGTGYRLGSFSSMVQGFRLITAEGEVLDCSPSQNPEVFEAGRCSLGALGVMSQITLQNRTPYRLEERIRVISLGETLQHINQWKDQHRHVEFWAFPFGDKAVLKTLDQTTEAPTPHKDNSFSEDFLLGLVSELARLFPLLNPRLQKLVSTFVSPSRRVGDSFRIFPSPRSVRFNEMEYHLPAEQGPECLAEVAATIVRHRVNVFFPLEYRYVAGDEVWLSPFYGGPRASIAVHQFYKQDHRSLFELVEPILRRHGGRPHWGKLHTLGAGELRELYPRWEEFLAVRQQLDPLGKFLNPHLQQVFGL